jgi:hypothetical protein
MPTPRRQPEPAPEPEQAGLDALLLVLLSMAESFANRQRAVLSITYADYVWRVHHGLCATEADLSNVPGCSTLLEALHAHAADPLDLDALPF